jgi:hypothetical protein
MVPGAAAADTAVPVKTHSESLAPMITSTLWSALRRRLGSAGGSAASRRGGAFGRAPGGANGDAAADSPWQPTQPMSDDTLPGHGLASPAAVHNDSHFDSQFDSRLDAAQLAADELHPAQAALIEQLRLGLADPGQPPRCASYGPGAQMHFDFQARLAFVDPRAQVQLRVERRLPWPASGVQAGEDAIVRELDEALWDLGVAAGPYRLLRQPPGWWRTPLRCTVGGIEIQRYTRVPRHLALARLLAQGAATPSALRRRAELGIGELRGFIQAGLVLGLLEWAGAEAENANAGAGAHPIPSADADAGANPKYAAGTEGATPARASRGPSAPAAQS